MSLHMPLSTPLEDISLEDITSLIRDIFASKELLFSTARSGGKGGQNVNKVETKVHLLFNIPNSVLMSEEIKQKLLATKKYTINDQGDLQIVSQEHRTQLQNKHRAKEKFSEFLIDALLPQKERIATKPTKASQEKRLSEKKKDSLKKKNRHRTDNE